MSVRVSDKIKQVNNATFKLMDAIDIEIVGGTYSGQSVEDAINDLTGGTVAAYVEISSAEGNALVKNDDGLYVESQSSETYTDEEIDLMVDTILNT